MYIKDLVSILKEQLETHEYLDVGKGTNTLLGVSQYALHTALDMLKDEGYKVYRVMLPKIGTEQMAVYKILTKDDKSWENARSAIRDGSTHASEKRAENIR